MFNNLLASFCLWLLTFIYIRDRQSCGSFYVKEWSFFPRLPSFWGFFCLLSRNSMALSSSGKYITLLAFVGYFIFHWIPIFALFCQDNLKLNSLKSCYFASEENLVNSTTPDLFRNSSLVSIQYLASLKLLEVSIIWFHFLCKWLKF